MNDTNGQYSRIEKATTITGNIISETDLRIDGNMDGTVTTKGKIIIGYLLPFFGYSSCFTREFFQIIQFRPANLTLSVHSY